LDKKTAIQSAQLRHLLSVSKVSLAASVLLAVILTYMQREVTALPVLLAWCSFMVLASLLRAVLVFVYQRFPVDAGAAVRVRLQWFRLGVLVAGAIWGSAGFLLFPDNHPQHQMFLIFMLAGLTAGGVVSFSADLTCAVVFSVSAILPLTIRLLAAGNDLSLAMGASTLLYLGFMIMSLRRINLSICENIALRLEAAAREEKVRVSEERYRLLLNHSPVGIFHYDTNLVITYCNKLLADILHSSIDNIVGLDMKSLKDQALLPALRKALSGELGYYEGYYRATLSVADGWIFMTCAPFCGDTGEIVGGIAIVQDVSERKAAEEEIKYLAFYDPLTHLPNRRLLLDRLKQAQASSSRNGREGALLFIDLDNFKALNDTLGHDIGDLLLQQVAERLTACVREGDTVARLGGDEFVVLLEDLSEQAFDAAAQTEIIGEKIIAALNQPYRLATHECHSTPSIGATLINSHQYGIDDLLKQADIAMYQSKKAGRNTLRFFDPQMQASITARVEMEGELRKALERQQFQLYYQIQVASSHRALGAEALIRWQHDGFGLVSPADFIPLAEETGMILPVGQWVLETACAQIRKWESSPLTCDLQLAVNVSPRQFRQADFVEQVRRILIGSGIKPDRLKLELTESLVLDDIDDTIHKMNALRDIGVRFAMDDFGTGHS